MLSPLAAALRAGLVAGALLGIADVFALAAAREMFFDTRELARTAAWALGMDLGAGMLVAALLLGLQRLLESVFKKLRWEQRTLLPAALVTALAAGPLAALLFRLTSGPQASGMSGRWALVVLGAILLAAPVGAALVLLPRWADRGSRRGALGVATLGTIAALHAADAAVLVRLYPAFHYALTALAFTAGAFGAALVWPRTGFPRLLLTASAGILGLAAVALFLALGTQNPRYVIGHATAHAADILVLTRAVTPLDAEAVLDAAEDEVSPDEPFVPAGLIARPGADLVLITVDAMRYDRLALLGARREVTPHIDALARRSVVFSRAYTPVPHTSYAVTSLLTGKYTRPLFEVPGAPKRHETWPEILHRFRYETSAFFTPAIFFIDKERFRPYLETGAGFSYRKAGSRLTAEERVDQLLEHLRDKQKSGKPHFAWAHFFEAHEPYDPQCRRFGDGPEDRYDCELSTVDNALGRLFEYLDQQRPDAIVVVTSDHGEEFGDHGGKYHGTTLYDEQVRVPLVMKIPGVEHRIIDAPVSLVDLLGTGLALLDLPVPARVRSRNLVPLIAGVPVETEAFAEAHDEIMAVKDGYKAVCDTRDDLCRLYDLAADPGERRSVAAENEERLRRMKGRIYAWRKSHAEEELRPVVTAEGVEGWPAAIERALAGDEDVAADLVKIINGRGAARIRRKAAELLFSTGSGGTDSEGTLTWEGEADAVVAAWIALIQTSSKPAEALRFLAGAAPGLEKGSGVARAVSLARLEGGDKGAARDVLDVALDGLAPVPERQRALALLETAGDRSMAAELMSLINTYQISLEVIHALAALRAKTALDAIVTRLKRERFSERKAAIIDSLVLLNDRRAAPALADELLNDAPPPGAIRGLAALVKASHTGRDVATSDRSRRVTLFKVDTGALTVRADRVKRLVVDTTAHAEGAGVVAACSGETLTVPVDAAGQATVDFSACRSDEKRLTITLGLSPADLDAEIRHAAVTP